MLIDEWRPKLYCKDIECQNLSPNGRVLFLEDGHKYYHEDDICNGSIKDFEESKFAFRSPTGLLKDFYEEFETEMQAQKYVKKHKLPITWEQLMYAWEMLGFIASDEGTILHGYGESLFNGWGMPRPDLHKTQFVEGIHRELTYKHKLAKTELLVYSATIRLAGQVDLLMKNEDSSKYYLYDYKFLREPLEMKSYYNRFTRRYKMMGGPFNRLMDCSHIHYSIQMELYRYLMGALGKKVVSKKLMVVTPEGYEFIDGHPMRIWVDKEGILHARYPHYKGRIYDSSEDPEYLENSYRII